MDPALHEAKEPVSPPPHNDVPTSAGGVWVQAALVSEVNYQEAQRAWVPAPSNLNSDQTVVQFDAPDNVTVEVEGKKIIRVLTMGVKRQRCGYALHYCGWG